MTDPNDPRPDGGLPPLSRRDFLQVAGVTGAGLALGHADATALPLPVGTTARPAMAPGAAGFDVAFDRGALTAIAAVGDALATNYVTAERRLGDVALRYRRGNGEWQSFDTAAEAAAGRVEARNTSSGHEAKYSVRDGATSLFDIVIRYAVADSSLGWTIELANTSGAALEIGDLAVPLLIARNYRVPDQQGQGTILKHSYIGGDASFAFWMRSNSVGPYLLLTPDAGTSLEYWESQGGFRAFIHSSAAGAAATERGTDWRQPHTSLTLAPSGTRATRRYGFTFRWAEDYDAVRNGLVDAGLIDFHVVPGMTVPSDLFARFALRTRQPIAGVDAEFPAQTSIRALGRNGDAHIYEVRFSKLGENRLTVRYGQNQRMQLEWFVTEPVETLIAKRAAFIVKKQIRDANKWYNGLLAEWNMDTHVLLSPDNYDKIRGWRIYAVTCDDPGLSKPAFLASKLAEYPTQEEVAALDYYIEHFVWGGLQRKSDESFAYGIYGIPDWKQNRESADAGRNGRLHLWRIYDYPHIALMYYSMYRVASEHPQIRTALPADEYLRRAANTAIAMFTIPTEIEGWSAYRTGLYNELVISDILRALEEKKWDLEHLRLRLHWERKVQFFINGDPNLFQSEYAFDSTGFESTHALVKYALANGERLAQQRPANEKFPPIPRENTLRFMEKQMAANLFCRGWIEPNYYHLGSDYRGGGGDRYTLTYMSQMGGWSVLDYALYHSPDPHRFLRLGYASLLSAWALMNSGTRESNYGHWYPGPENDGGAGGGFEASPFGNTWLEQPHTRGSWYYSCEIDLGFCGGLRGAATVVADDPIFGRFCYGGDLRTVRSGLEITPKDGVRRRFRALVGSGKLHLELMNDRFARNRPIVLHERLTLVTFALESDNAQPHTARLLLAGEPGRYVVQSANREVARVDLAAGQEVTIELPVPARGTAAEFSITRNG